MQIRVIAHGSREYDAVVGLRTEILRKPLGLSFTQEQLDKEKDDIIIGAFDQDRITGCCLLTHKNDSVIQLRQMAVSNNGQQKGTGRAIVGFAENIAREKGYKMLMMHARNGALGFYEKCGYKIVGREFTEVGIPHHQMEKSL